MIDVSELLDDPDFLFPGGVLCVRRSYSVNTYGETVASEVPELIQAIVQPGSGDMLERLPEAARLKESIRIWTKEPLIVEAENQYADIIIYNDRRWLVQVVVDWTVGGQNYTKAVAIGERPAR